MIDVYADIMAEPQVVKDTLAEVGKRLPRIVEEVARRNIDNICIVGVGSSYFVALAAQYIIQEASGIPALAFSSMDYQRYYQNQLKENSALIAVSQSGETFETVDAVRAASKSGVYTIALTNNEDSSLAQLCDDLILLRAGVEEGPGTKTVLAQCVAIYSLGVHLQGGGNGGLVEGLEIAPEMVAEMLSDEYQAELEPFVEHIAGQKVLYIIGAGPFWPLALQHANVLREMSKIHCFPFEATEFRHGPLEVISRDSTVLVLSSGDCRGHDQAIRAANLCKEAGAAVLYVGDAAGGAELEADQKLILPEMNEFLGAQLYLVPLQLLSYLVTKRIGLNPGEFVNIVKTWTQ